MQTFNEQTRRAHQPPAGQPETRREPAISAERDRRARSRRLDRRPAGRIARELRSRLRSAARARPARDSGRDAEATARHADHPPRRRMGDELQPRAPYEILSNRLIDADDDGPTGPLRPLLGPGRQQRQLHRVGAATVARSICRSPASWRLPTGSTREPAAPGAFRWPSWPKASSATWSTCLDKVPKQTAETIWRDYQRGGRPDRPAFLSPYVERPVPAHCSRSRRVPDDRLGTSSRSHPRRTCGSRFSGRSSKETPSSANTCLGERCASISVSSQIANFPSSFDDG